MFGFLKPKTNKIFAAIDGNKDLTSPDITEKYKAEIKKIKIENQPFGLSKMLHILTNKVSELLQSNRHVIYYDIESDIGRYIIGDNDYIEQVLEILLKDALFLNMDHEVILKISKLKNKFIIFEVINEKRVMKREECNQYLDSERILQNLNQNTNAFIKAKKIAEAMNGSIALKSGRVSGTHYTFQIPFYEDKDRRNNQEALKTFLRGGENALFIGKDKHDTKRAQYIFETYGIHIDNIKLDNFEKKRPDLRKYNMAIMRSADLTHRHVSFFKNIYQDEKSNFKIIIVYELFEAEEKIALSKSIAHAELYSPIVIGDVEEILYQMFIFKSNAVKEISNIEIFDPDTFTINGSSKIKEDDVNLYKGARIAIVEDSKVDQRVIKNILKIDGVTLFCLQHGAEMIELLEIEEIDMIFSDINMPVMDGLIMTKNIRAKKKWEHIPIISISSMAFAHEIKEMRSAGMNAAISKPIEAKEIYAALEIFLVMTAKIRNREVNDHKVKFLYNKEVINFDKGLKKVKSGAHFQKKLLNTMKTFKGTRESFEKMIYKQQYAALGNFANSALFMYEEIHATAMIKMFKELTHFVSQGQRVYLIDYIYLYQENWKKLEKEVERYIKQQRIKGKQCSDF